VLDGTLRIDFPTAQYDRCGREFTSCPRASSTAVCRREFKFCDRAAWRAETPAKQGATARRNDVWIWTLGRTFSDCAAPSWRWAGRLLESVEELRTAPSTVWSTCRGRRAAGEARVRVLFSSTALRDPSPRVLTRCSRTDASESIEIEFRNRRLLLTAGRCAPAIGSASRRPPAVGPRLAAHHCMAPNASNPNPGSRCPDRVSLYTEAHPRPCCESRSTDLARMLAFRALPLLRVPTRRLERQLGGARDRGRLGDSFLFGSSEQLIERRPRNPLAARCRGSTGPASGETAASERRWRILPLIRATSRPAGPFSLRDAAASAGSRAASPCRLVWAQRVVDQVSELKVTWRARSSPGPAPCRSISRRIHTDDAAEAAAQHRAFIHPGFEVVAEHVLVETDGRARAPAGGTNRRSRPRWLTKPSGSKPARSNARVSSMPGVLVLVFCPRTSRRPGTRGPAARKRLDPHALAAVSTERHAAGPAIP